MKTGSSPAIDSGDDKNCDCDCEGLSESYSLSLGSIKDLWMVGVQYIKTGVDTPQTWRFSPRVNALQVSITSPDSLISARLRVSDLVGRFDV